MRRFSEIKVTEGKHKDGIILLVSIISCFISIILFIFIIYYNTRNNRSGSLDFSYFDTVNNFLNILHLSNVYNNKNLKIYMQQYVN